MSTNLLSIAIMWVAAIGLGIFAWSRPGNEFRGGVKFAWDHLREIFFLLVLALLLASYLEKLIPEELVGHWLGEESGIRGILLASAIGGFIPGGPMITFPLILALFKMNVAVPSLVAFITAWSVYAANRVIMFEVPLMGWRFTVLRLSSTFFIPPLTGVVAGLLVDFLRSAGP